MSGNNKMQPKIIYFIALPVVGWIDVFTRKEYLDELVDDLNYCSGHKGMNIYSYCIMPSHVHIICTIGRVKLSEILIDFKSYSGKQIIKLIETNSNENRKEWLLNMFRHYKQSIRHTNNYQFWDHKHSIERITEEMLQQKIDYIEQRPVEAGLVTKADDYTFSSANPNGPVKLA
ncbi:transposase [Pontibacter sp. KCTC 32443]|uniref:transposase n=1 Tax=Pontibacter TaxID=323449 RepID=UPI00164ED81A|nr:MULTISPECIES: transposase [Pontibacter]MBC5775114.1 transposase [Pontibacter sp. KCTC 32443]